MKTAPSVRKYRLERRPAHAAPYTREEDRGLTLEEAERKRDEWWDIGMEAVILPDDAPQEGA